MTSRRVWPWRLAASEGVATARTGRWTSVLMMVAVAWLVAAPGAADARMVTQLIEDERAWIDAGGYVFVVTGARVDGANNPVPAQICDRLSRIDGIDASFALKRTNASAATTHIPGGRASVYDVSPGAVTFLGAGPVDGGLVLITAGFAERTGMTSGDAVQVVRRAGFDVAPGTSDVLEAQVVDSQVMGEEFSGSLLMPTNLTGDADECYVRTDAAHVQAVEAALPAYLAHEGMPAIPNPRLFSGEFTVDYTNAYAERPLRWVWVASAAMVGVLWAMMQWFRRSHTAIYATFGMRAPSRLIMNVSEWAVLASAGLLWGWALGVVGALALGARTAQALSLVTFHGLLTVLGATLIVALLGLRPTGTLLNALKDR